MSQTDTDLVIALERRTSGKRWGGGGGEERQKKIIPSVRVSPLRRRIARNDKDKNNNNNNDNAGGNSIHVGGFPPTLSFSLSKKNKIK